MQEQYIKDALRTESTNFEMDVDTFNLLNTLLRRINQQVAILDTVKKSIFYGKSIDVKKLKKAIFSLPNDEEEYVDFSEDEFTAMTDLSDVRTQRLLHAGIGLVTEALEFLQPLGNTIKYGDILDVVNLKEEIGDINWYQAIGLDALESSFQDVQDINISKLSLRYPEKFTDAKALNRDLAGEREVLEGGSK